MIYKSLLPVLLILFLVIFFNGCYTQLGTIRNEDESYLSKENEGEDEYYQDTTQEVRKKYKACDEDVYCDNYYPRYRVGFSYYYPSYYWPSYAFSVAYFDPWFYDYYWAYDPWFYRTYYYPHYRYWYYYPYYYYPYVYSYTSKPVQRGTRDFGTTRGYGGRGSTINTDYQIPTESRMDGSLPVGVGVDRTKTVEENRSTTGVRPSDYRSEQRRDGSRINESSESRVRGMSSRGGRTRSYQNRDSQDRAPEVNSQSQKEDYNTTQRETRGRRDVGATRSNTPSYNTPPPSHNTPTPQSSNPPPSDRGSRSDRDRRP